MKYPEASANKKAITLALPWKAAQYHAWNRVHLWLMAIFSYNAALMPRAKRVEFCESGSRRLRT